MFVKVGVAEKSHLAGKGENLRRAGLKLRTPVLTMQNKCAFFPAFSGTGGGMR